jgi:uncharacterized protein (TIGR02246 family)
MLPRFAAKNEGGVMSATVAEQKTEILAMIQAWEKAANAKDAPGIAALYAEDATLLPPGQSAVKGRQNIQAFWQGFLNAGASDVKLQSTEIAGSGTVFYEIGEFSAMMPQPTGGTAPGTGKYIVVYGAQVDGTLKIVADIFNSNA